MKILRMADEAGGNGNSNGGAGGATSWLSTLPEDLRGNPSLKSFQDVPSLAKSYIETKALVGADKILKPTPKWTDKEWGEFWTAAGRPEAPDKYEVPAIEGAPEGFDLGDQLKAVREISHELGLNNAQARKLQEKYGNLAISGRKMEIEATEKGRAEAESALKKEWGDKYDHNLQVAMKAVETFGGSDLKKYLDDSKLGNNPQFIKAMAKVGLAMMEDQAIAAKSGFNISDAQAARSELEQMKSDKATMDKYFAGDPATVQRWQMLQAKAAAK